MGELFLRSREEVEIVVGLDRTANRRDIVHSRGAYIVALCADIYCSSAFYKDLF